MKNIIFNGKKIPYDMYDNAVVVLNKNKKDYPDEVNQIIYEKHPKVLRIEHNSYFTEVLRKKRKFEE